MQPGNPDFRTDINGLRAYAVLAVLAYHFGLPGAISGYCGVDVFFVISGYLMASLILPKLEKKTFRLRDFYAARIRRIFPALAVLIAVLLAAGWFALGPTDYRLLGRHASSSLAFFSNFIYRAEEGYFDAPSRDKWLLHTWSLGVEAQFYLLFPLLLLWMRRLSAIRRNQVLMGLLLVALALTVIYTPLDQPFAFYLLPTRTWELLAGSLLFIAAPRIRLNPTHAAIAETLGIALIILSACLFADGMQWPGYRSMLPVAGALLVLAAARQHSFLTGNGLMQRIGLWSYSIYLWHWPLVVALYYAGADGRNSAVALAVALSFALGAASYYAVELPSQRYARNHPRRFYRALGIVFALLGAAAVIAMLGNGLEWRFAEPVRIADREGNNRDEFRINCGFDTKRGTLIPCPVGDGKPVRYVLWGDSHVGNIATALRDTVKGGIWFYSHACPTIFDTEIYSKGLKNRCRDFNNQVLAQVAATPAGTRVIVANRYAVNLLGPNEGTHRKWGFVYDDVASGDPRSNEELYRDHVVASFCRIARVRPLYVMKPTPEFGFDVPRRQVRRLIFGQGKKEITMKLDAYETRNRAVLEALDAAAKQCPGVTLVDPLPYVCKNGQCPATQDGRPLYVDDNHLSNFGNRRLMPLFARLFRNALRSDWKTRQSQAPIGPAERSFH